MSSITIGDSDVGSSVNTASYDAAVMNGKAIANNVKLKAQLDSDISFKKQNIQIKGIY